jgi:dienelactone hydrolase
VNRLNSQSQACPDQKFALVGYSQGARVIHLAAPKIDKALYPKIVAIVTFGDPGQKNPNGTPERPAVDLPAEMKAKLKMNCAKGDPACDKDSKNDFGPHLTYNNKGTAWQADSAAFIAAAFQGQTLPKVNNDPAKH